MEPFSVAVHIALVVAQVVTTWKFGFAHFFDVSDEMEDEYDDMTLHACSRARANARIETFFSMIVNAFVVSLSSHVVISALHGSFNPVSWVVVPFQNIIYEALGIESNWTAIWMLSALYLLIVSYLLAACSAYTRQMIESACETAYLVEYSTPRSPRRPSDVLRRVLAFRSRLSRSQERR